MVAQLGNDLAVEEQQQLAAQQQQVAVATSVEQQQLAAQQLAVQQQQLATQQPQLDTTLVRPTLATTLAHSSAMAHAGAASREASYATATEENVDMLSDNSLTVSPDAKRPPRSRAGARSLSNPRGRKADGKKIGVTRPLMARARFDSPGARPPRMRPPAPSPVDIPRPCVVHPLSNGVEARLTAMEMQRANDHATMNAVVDALMIVQADVGQPGTAFGALTQPGFELRQQLSAARSEIASCIAGANDAAQNAAMAQMAISVEAKFAQMDALTAELTAAIQTLGLRENIVEHVVEQVAAGGADAFMQMDAKISRVAALARSADGTAIVARAHNVVPFTAAMSADMQKFREELAAMPGHVTAEIIGQMQPLVADLAEVRVRVLGHDESLAALEASFDKLSLATAESASILATPPGFAPQCAGCGPAAPTSLWGHSPAVPAPGQAGPSGAGDPFGAMKAVTGGNQICHCIHVKELGERVEKLEAATRPAAATFRPDPWSQVGREAVPSSGTVPGAHEAPQSSLPLRLTATLGSIGYKDRPIFDHKMTLQDEYRFNGTKDGIKWKNKVHGYFVTCAPVLLEVLRWAECQDQTPISNETFTYAVSMRLSEEQSANLTTQMWGFLAAVVSGSAETMFKRADRCVGEMNGIDAWRRLVRHIDHGRDIRLDDLRHEMKLMHLRTMKNLEDVEQGVAAFENSIYDFVQAGGPAPSDKEMKDDLLRLLPEKIQCDLLWNASNVEVSFAKFRDIVVSSTTRILNIKRPHRGVHRVDDEAPEVNCRLPEDMDRIDMAAFEGVTNTEELIAAFQKYSGKKIGAGRTQDRDQRRPRREGGGREAKRCANCGGEHDKAVCSKPMLPMSGRKCWTCGEKHMARDCPKKQRGPIKALEDGSISAITSSALNGFFAVDHEGYQMARGHRGHRGPLHGGHTGIREFDLKKNARPMPSQPTLESFLTKNHFEALSGEDLRHDTTRHDTTRHDGTD